MKTDYWAYLGIAVLCLLFLATCDSCDDTDEEEYIETEQTSNSDFDNSVPSWIQGTWTCVTPYGNMQVEIVGDHIREIPGDGSSYYGTYHIDGDYLIPNSGSGMHYEMEKSSRRLSAGQGYYFQKQ